MEAARGGFKDIVEELAKRGADLNMRTVRALDHPKARCQPYIENGPRDEAIILYENATTSCITIIHNNYTHRKLMNLLSMQPL